MLEFTQWIIVLYVEVGKAGMRCPLRQTEILGGVGGGVQLETEFRSNLHPQKLYTRYAYVCVCVWGGCLHNLARSTRKIWRFVPPVPHFWADGGDSVAHPTFPLGWASDPQNPTIMFTYEEGQMFKREHISGASENI